MAEPEGVLLEANMGETGQRVFHARSAAHDGDSAEIGHRLCDLLFRLRRARVTACTQAVIIPDDRSLHPDIPDRCLPQERS